MSFNRDINDLFIARNLLHHRQYKGLKVKFGWLDGKIKFKPCMRLRPARCIDWDGSTKFAFSNECGQTSRSALQIPPVTELLGNPCKLHNYSK